MITRIFHQIWVGPDPLPAEFAECRETWARLHPEWEMRLWDEDTLPRDLRHREVYDQRRSPAERSDIARLELLWRFGGVYLDVDFECRRPIDGLLDGVEFFAGMLKADRVNNAIFGSAPGHPLLERALQTLRPQALGGTFDKSASGAHFFSGLVMDAEGVQLFPATYFYPSTPEQREEAYAVHLVTRSWKDLAGWRKAALRAEERLDQITGKLEKERQAHERTKRKLAQLEEKVAARAAKRDGGEREAPPPRTPLETEAETARLSILFFLRSIHFDRVFENFLRAMLERGHQIHVALPLEKRGLGENKTRLFEEFRSRYAFNYEKLPPRRDRWLALAVALRHGLDYLRYLEPVYASAAPLRERARLRAPRLVRLLVATPPFGTRVGRRLVAGALRRVEVAIPVPTTITALIGEHEPDVVLVSPLVGLGSIEVDYLRAAQRAQIPTVLPVASWDNLTNKGLLHDVPTLTVVWNELQVEEAVRLHDVPRDRVVAVGAHSFDHWFKWEPGSSRTEFAQRLGLDPERPLLLYFGSSHFISGDETVYVREWLERVRAHPALREAAVILRPHPQNVVGWAELDVDEPGKTIVWPRGGVAPVDDVTKREFYDSLYHANGTIGINTSALIEAAIMRRPAFTLADGRFATQSGTLHFSYIAGHESSPVVVGKTWDEHLDQIAEAIAKPGLHRARSEQFLATFVRPRGIDMPAAQGAVAAVERAARETVPAPRLPLLRLLFVLLTPFAWMLGKLLHPQRTWRQSRKQLKRWQKQLRRRRNETKRRGTRRLAKITLWAVVQKGTERRRARTRKKFMRLMKVNRRRWKRTKFVVRTVANMRLRFTYRSTLRFVPSRDELPVLLNARGLHGYGAEIGVKTGRFSAHLLERWRGRLLISIDPWLSVDADEYVDRSNVSQDEFEAYYQQTKARLAPFGSRSEILRTTSLEAASAIDDGSLDFVYIDARHDYESVKEDLGAWFSKLKPGGIFAGHDYADGRFPQGDFGVKSAVDEFFAERGIPVHVTQGPSAVELFPTWIVEIPAGLLPELRAQPAEREAEALV